MKQEQESDFKTDKEVYEWLLDGGAIDQKDIPVYAKLYEGNRTWFNKDTNEETISSVLHLHAIHYRKYNPTVPWYESITEQGVLCWVWNTKEEKKEITVVNSFVKELWHKYRTKSSSFVHAVPLTDQEIQTFKKVL